MSPPKSPSTSTPSTTPFISSYPWRLEPPWPQFPSLPGVYYFKDGHGTVLYVGKAKNLKARLATYRRSGSPKTSLLTTKIRTVTTETTTSEIQALVKETAAIKTFQPRFNSRLKDDKSPLYIVITKDTYPRVLTLRRPQIEKYLGQLEISNCFGPFPTASTTKKLFHALRQIFPFCNQTPQQKLRHQACFYYHLNLCPGACIGNISPPAYRRNLKPLAVFLSGQTQEVYRQLTRQMLNQVKTQNFEAAAAIRNQLYLLNHLPLKNFPDWESPPASTQKLHQLYLILSPFFPALKSLSRIEGYDVSNLGGQWATGSMVVFIGGQPAKNHYRHFKISPQSRSALGRKTLSNDVAMLKEVITRRLRHPEWGIPHLLLIDGGKAQLNSLLPLTYHLPIIALAKREETIFTPKGTLNLPSDHPALHLLQAIRDEAHRFARSYHLKLRDTIIDK